MFAITQDRTGRLLRLQLTGFWDLETVELFKAEYRRSVAALRCPSGSHLVLADARTASAQSQEVIGSLMRFLEGFEDKALRLAFVTDSVLVGMQARRLLSRPHLLVTDNLAEAEAYLAAPSS
ncbi:MAG: hypothetical protein ABW184_13980 [Sphingobium sp.]